MRACVGAGQGRKTAKLFSVKTTRRRRTTDAGVGVVSGRAAYRVCGQPDVISSGRRVSRALAAPALFISLFACPASGSGPLETTEQRKRKKCVSRKT